jgi:hypothetical protein
MPNYRVHTLSGAMYTLNEEKMFWHRRTPTSGAGVHGLVEESGTLTDKVIVQLGERMIVPIAGPTGPTYIRTTPVVKAEITSEI